jgi:hypothetical protein
MDEVIAVKPEEVKEVPVETVAAESIKSPEQIEAEKQQKAFEQHQQMLVAQTQAMNVSIEHAKRQTIVQLFNLINPMMGEILPSIEPEEPEAEGEKEKPKKFHVVRKPNQTPQSLRAKLELIGQVIATAKEVGEILKPAPSTPPFGPMGPRGMTR